MNSFLRMITRVPLSRAPHAAVTLALGALLAGGLPPAFATPTIYTYTGGTGGKFSAGFDGDVTKSTTTDTLKFGGGSYTATDDVGNINVNSLSFSNTGAVILAAATGANSITLGGSNPSMTLNSNNTGTVALGLNIVLANNATFTGTGSSATISGAVSGAFSLTKSGANTLVLSGANTYSGATIMNGGFLTVGVASVAGASGALGVNSAVTFTNTTAASISLVNNSVSYDTQIGSLAGGNASSSITLGNAALTLGGDGTSTTYLGGSISGAGSIVKIGAGTQTLIGSNAYKGSTTINGGTLSGTTNSFGTAAISISDKATLNLGGSTGTLSNTVMGGGSVTVGGNAANPTAANAVIVMNGSSDTYSGGTTVNSGTLSGSAGSYGSGAVSVAQGATVDYTQSGTGTAGNNISGAGSVTFGGYAASLNGKGGTINYTGQDNAAATTVASGSVTLSRTGGSALTGPVAVATGGALTISASATNNEIATSIPPATAPTTAAVTLNGGTLNVSGSDGAVSNPTTLATTTVTASMGALAVGGTKTNPSLLAFGAGGTLGSPFVLAFADSSGTFGSGYLNITGYTGTTNALYIGTTSCLQPQQLARIGFNGTFGVTQRANGEIAAAPEPSAPLSFVVGIGALCVLVGSRRRKSAAHGA